MSIAKDIAKDLLQIKAIKLSPQNPFTWASGIKSPIYCDNRMTLSYPEIRQKVKNELALLAKTFDGVEAISGVATAGIAHGALAAEALDLPFTYVRSKAKAHGRKNTIEGRVVPGQKVVVVEDLISTGGSSILAVESLREAGLEVLGVVAIFTYGFDEARENFKKADCSFKTLSDYSSLIDVALEQNFISSEEVEILKSWRKNINIPHKS